MPTSEAKTSANEPNEPAVTPPKRASTGPLNLSFPEAPLSSEDDDGSSGPIRRGASTSRWVDYDTHELLSMISELEDERRWARLREGIWIALLVHLVLISGITWIPKYIF